MTDTVESRWEAHNEAGRRYFGQGDYANAEQAFVAAIREASALGDNNVRLASSLSNFGQLKYKQKDLVQAEALFRRALAIRESVLGPEHFGLVQNLNNLAALHYARGELEQAEPLFARALTISEQALGEAHPDVGVTLNNLARLYFRRNDFKAAAPLLLRLLTIKQETLGASHPEVAAILTSLAKVRFAEGDYDAGEQLARRALAVREQIHVPNDPAIATALETLAEICGARGKQTEELALRGRALTIREGTMGADHPTVVAARASLATRRVSAETRIHVDPPISVRTPDEAAAIVPAPVAPPAVTEVSAAPGLIAFPPTPPVGQPAIAATAPPPAAAELSVVHVEPPEYTAPVDARASEAEAGPRLEIAPLIEMPGAKPVAATPAAPPAPPPAAPPISGSRPVASPAAPRRPSSGAQSPPTTTKTRSLPWIEPPNSELVLSRTQTTAPRPAAPKPPSAPIVPPAAPPAAPPAPPAARSAAPPTVPAPVEAPRPRTPPAPSDVIEVGGPSKTKTPAESYANLLTHATADGVERARIEVVTGVQPVVRSEVSLEDYHIPKKRSWGGLIAAVVIVGILAAGGYLLWQRLAAARSAKDLSPATSAAGTVAGNPEPKPVRVDSVAPPAPKAAPVEEERRPAPPPPPAPAPTKTAAASVAPPEEDPGAPPKRAAALPVVNIDKITQAIADSAKAHVDSASKSLGVNPPTFKPGNPPR